MTKLPGLRPLVGALDRLLHRSPPAALILMYHRVADLATDPWALAVRPDRFAEQLQVLRKDTRPMSLSDLTRALVAGRVPRRAVVVTFDDGYADNLTTALPLLERFDVPATFFVTSGYLGAEREVWSDELGRLLLEPGTLPQRLRITIGGEQHEWSLGETADYEEASFERHRAWNFRQEGYPTARQYVCRAVHQLLQPLPEDERQQVMGELRAWSGLPAPGRPSNRTMTPEQLLALAGSGLAEIGSHTVTHPVLPRLSGRDQSRELRRSKADLEGILGRPVRHFAYPYGEKWGPTVGLVRAAGYASACTAAPRAIRQAGHQFSLPRLHVEDWDGECFARRVDELLAGPARA